MILLPNLLTSNAFAFYLSKTLPKSKNSGALALAFGKMLSPVVTVKTEKVLSEYHISPFFYIKDSFKFKFLTSIKLLFSYCNIYFSIIFITVDLQ